MLRSTSKRYTALIQGITHDRSFRLIPCIQRYVLAVRRMGFLALLLAGLSACSDSDDAQPLQLHGGQSLPLAALQNKTLVVNVWAPWCAPCRDEIPELNALHAEEEGIVVLGIDFDRHAPDELPAVLQLMGITFPQLAESAEARWNLQRPGGLPVTYIIDEGVQVVAQLRGPQTRESLLAAIPATDE